MLHGQTFATPHDRNPAELKAESAFRSPAPRWEWLVLTVAEGVVIAKDGYDTSFLRRGHCAEISTPWLYGRYPGDHKAWLSLAMAGELAGSSLAGRWLQKRHSRWWWVPQTALIATHSHGITQQYAGCR